MELAMQLILLIKQLEESKAKLLKDINDEERANLIMSRMKKQMNKKN